MHHFYLKICKQKFQEKHRWSLNLKSNDVTSKLKNKVLIMESWQSVQSICGMESIIFRLVFSALCRSVPWSTPCCGVHTYYLWLYDCWGEEEKRKPSIQEKVTKNLCTIWSTGGKKLACDYSHRMLGASWVPWEKRLWFKPKNYIVMTSICPEFKHCLRLATLLLFLYN